MSQSEDAKSLRLTLGLYLIIFIHKASVYLVSGVMALLAEALHTLSDLFIIAFLLIAEKVSHWQADEEHMFGHGRAQNIAALVAATLLISFTSFELYRESVPHLFKTESPEYRNLGLVIAVLFVSMIIAAVPLIRLVLQNQRGAAAKAQLMELMNDELGLLAAMVGAFCISLGIPIADPVASIIVATIIAINAVGLFRENLSYLLGLAPSNQIMTQIQDLALATPGVLSIRDLRAVQIGPNSIHVDLFVEIDPNLTVMHAQEIIKNLSNILKPLLGNGSCSIQIYASNDKST